MQEEERQNQFQTDWGNEACAHASMQDRKRDGKTVVVSGQSLQISCLLPRPEQSFSRRTHRPASSSVIVRENILWQSVEVLAATAEQ